MYSLKAYQEIAVNQLLHFYQQSAGSTNNNILLDAPTGAGKTVMMGAFIQKLFEEYSDIAIIWLSIGKSGLHLQSRDKLKILIPTAATLTQEDILSTNKLALNPRDILFLNWESITKKDRKTKEWTNIFMKDSEYMTLPKLMENCIQDQIKRVVIIDEAHANSSSPRYDEILSIIEPTSIINVTATPRKKQLELCKNYIVSIPTEKVIEEGVIKKSLVVNKGIRCKKNSNIISDLLDTALRRRNQLKQLYEKEESVVNPLCLIQLPNGDRGGALYLEIIDYLKRKDITTENNKLAVWLTSDKINLDVISNISAPQEFLIFKQAIDTGWDCPRAQILVKFRDIKSEIFQAQVTGRILRMPELHHYRNENLNSAYIFTDEDQFQLDKPDQLPTGLNILQDQIQLKDSYLDIAPYIMVPTFPYFKLNDHIETKALMLDFVSYLKEKIPIFVESYQGNEDDFTTSIPLDIVFDVSEGVVTTHSEKKVRWTPNLLRSLILALMGERFEDKKFIHGIFDYLMNKQPEDMDVQTYLEVIAFNMPYILDELNQLIILYSTHPTVDLTSLKLTLSPLPLSVQAHEGYQSNEVFNKYLYTHFPNKIIGTKEHQLIEEFEKDDSISWWFYNKIIMAPLNIPCIIGGILNWYQPKFIICKNGKILIVDYTSNEENFKALDKMYKIWKYLCKLPNYDVDLRFL